MLRFLSLASCWSVEISNPEPSHPSCGSSRRYKSPSSVQKYLSVIAKGDRNRHRPPPERRAVAATPDRKAQRPAS